MTDTQMVIFGSKTITRDQAIMLIDIAVQNQNHVHELLTSRMINANVIGLNYLSKKKKIGGGFLARLFMGTTERMKKLDKWKQSYDALVYLMNGQLEAADSNVLSMLRGQFLFQDAQVAIAENTAARITVWQEVKAVEAAVIGYDTRMTELSRELYKL